MALSRSLGWTIVAAFALVALAVLGSGWAMRGAVIDAVDEEQGGEALEAAQTVLAELPPSEPPPDSDELAAILHDHGDQGLRYLALVDHGRVLAAAGTSTGGPAQSLDGRSRKVEVVHGRITIEVRNQQQRRRMRNEAWRGKNLVVEIEPVEAEAMRSAATRTVGIGALAALGLLGVVIVLVRRELRRQADERIAERDKRLASLGEMSAVLAHEIKNPLASLKGNAQLLAAMLPEGEKPRAKAQRVVDEALRLEQLTVDLLEFVRTGALARTPADPAALVREAAASVAPDIAVDAAGAPVTWSLDAARVRQVLVNLLDNAIAAGPPVRAAVRAESGQLVVEVADRGPGVPEADREKIFEPFQTGKTQGTGLGLAVARRVVEQHGGAITVHDAPGGGALFRVTIPA